MPRPTHPSVEKPGAASSAAERLVWLLDTLWNGNRSEMARAVGCTHSVLAKIATGKQEPGRELLSKVASHPKVNPGWLMSGQGEPLLSDSTASPSDGWPLPITNRLFAGSPEENRPMMTGETFPLAGAFYRPSRYWMEIQHSEPFLQFSPKLQAEDLLLMETDKSWLQEPHLLDQRICIARVKIRDEHPLKLCLATWNPWPEDEPPLTVLFEAPEKLKELTRTLQLQFLPSGEVKVSERRARADGRRVSQVRLSSLPEAITPDAVVAMSVLVVRR